MIEWKSIYQSLCHMLFDLRVLQSINDKALNFWRKIKELLKTAVKYK